MCFRLLIGIPTWSDPAPLMASLFLYCYERKRLLQTEKRDMRKVGIFSNIFGFIDDLCSFNNDEFENNFDYIYPDELELKKENEDP